MNMKILLGGIAAAALTISGVASADYQGKSQGKSQGKGKSSSAHERKAQRGHSRQEHVMQESATTKEAVRTGAHCPPGLAKKNNGCVPPGQAKKRFAQGERLPAAFRANNVPAAYADQYRDSAASLYRYSSGSVYRIDPASRRIAEVIKLPTL